MPSHGAAAYDRKLFTFHGDSSHFLVEVDFGLKRKWLENNFEVRAGEDPLMRHLSRGTRVRAILLLKSFH